MAIALVRDPILTCPARSPLPQSDVSWPLLLLAATDLAAALARAQRPEGVSQYLTICLLRLWMRHAFSPGARAAVHGSPAGDCTSRAKGAGLPACLPATSSRYMADVRITHRTLHRSRSTRRCVSSRVRVDGAAAQVVSMGGHPSPRLAHSRHPSIFPHSDNDQLIHPAFVSLVHRSDGQQSHSSSSSSAPRSPCSASSRQTRPVRARAPLCSETAWHPADCARLFAPLQTRCTGCESFSRPTAAH